MNHCPPSEEVNMVDIKKSLSICHRTQRFLVNLAGPTARAKYNDEDIAQVFGVSSYVLGNCSPCGPNLPVPKRIRLEVGEQSSSAAYRWFPHLGGFSKDLSFLKPRFDEACVGAHALKLIEGCIPLAMLVGWNHWRISQLTRWQLAWLLIIWRLEH